MTIFVQKLPAGDVRPEVQVLVACDPYDYAGLDACKTGHRYGIKTRLARNPSHHNLVFVMLGAMFQNQEQYTSEDVYRGVVKHAVGWVYDEPMMIELNGIEHAIHQVKPLDWSRCDEEEFSEFHALLVPYALKEFGPEFVAQFEKI